MDLATRGVEFIPMPTLVCAPAPDGHPLVLHAMSPQASKP